MSTTAVLATFVQIALVGLGAPGLLGVMGQVRARLDGRVGPGVIQPYRTLAKLVTKEQVHPLGTTIVFAGAPAFIAGCMLVAAGAIPLVSTASPLNGSVDLFALVGLLLLGNVALVLAALDTGTPFGGMGASRTMTISALVEPTILLAVFALSIPAGSSNLASIVRVGLDHPARLYSPSGALALAALVVVVVAETGRLPVDNPSTHLELTMIHEAMLLEYSGPKLAVLEWAAAMRLAVLLGLLVNLYAPFGIAGETAGPASIAIGLVVVCLKITVAGALLAAVEVFLAKIRLFRVPELLAGSFLLGLLAVTASYFVAGARG